MSKLRLLPASCLLLSISLHLIDITMAPSPPSAGAQSFKKDVNGTVYNLITGPKVKSTWSDALKICQRFGQVLASAKSKEELQILQSLVDQAGSPKIVWLGGNVKNGKVFEWIEDNSPIESFAWNQGQPDSASQNDTCYALVHNTKTGEKSGDDQLCSEKNEFICKTLPKPSTFTKLNVPSSLSPPLLAAPAPVPLAAALSSTKFSCVGRPCGEYADENNCAAFYVCTEDKEKVIHKSCPGNLLFNEALQMCDDPDKVHCGRRSNVSEFSCEGKECDRYGDPNNCNGFFVCSENKNLVIHKFCPQGLYFDSKSRICNGQDRVNCTQ